MQLQQIDVTGSRVIGAVTKELGMDGPKHHAVVLGKNFFDGEVYVAELMRHGRQVVTFRSFSDRYAPNAPLRLEPNTGPVSDIQVAQRALSEVALGGDAYDLLMNNCESFVNRAMHGKSVSSQVVNTAIGVALVIGAYYMLKSSK